MLHYVVSRLVYFFILRRGDCIDFNESVAYSYALAEELGGETYTGGGADVIFFFFPFPLLVRFLMIRWETCLFEAPY